ncbi:Bacteriophage lambda head decoration protein D [Paenibacillus uliginis N3/975]|uniref:Bacteriophage lambda head decoration protein D n=1 Tax=Paenibacillus uliginis N3/975 TaxID=1313296 RepID=A0A1X7HK67_9BACL|nr:head decoration protein [Paenibacillus uliginis]SMF88167.1 Bacteriophage lambda head decoration protein D [Paenibacillus uliginis N3/975]
MAEYTSPSFDELFAGGVQPERMTAIIIKSGAGVVTRGTVLGRVSQLPESDLYAGTPIVVPVNSANTDGSENPYCILADTIVDATTGEARAAAYLDGEFNRDALKFGGTDKVAQHEVAMRNVGLITKRVVK